MGGWVSQLDGLATPVGERGVSRLSRQPQAVNITDTLLGMHCIAGGCIGKQATYVYTR